MSGEGGESGALVPMPERSLANLPGGLASRGLALATVLLSAPAEHGPPGELRCLGGHRGCVLSVGFSPDGRLGVSASWDGTVGAWELATGREAARLAGHSGRASGAAFLPDGRRLFSTSWDGTARL